MTPFGTRRDTLKDKVLEYLQKELDLVTEIKVDNLAEFLSSHDEDQMCDITHLEHADGEYRAVVRGRLNESEDSVELQEMSVDTLCNIADYVYFQQLQHEEK